MHIKWVSKYKEKWCKKDGTKEGTQTNKEGKKVQYIKLLCFSANSNKTSSIQKPRHFLSQNAIRLSIVLVAVRGADVTDEQDVGLANVFLSWRRQAAQRFLRPQGNILVCDRWRRIARIMSFPQATFLDLPSQAKPRNIFNKIRVLKLGTAPYWLITHYAKICMEKLRYSSTQSRHYNKGEQLLVANKCECGWTTEVIRIQ